jgi:hypothetical protein
MQRILFLVLVLGLIYGGFDLADAAGPPSIVTGSVTVANSSSNPVPVEQQGTATVNVNNSSVPVTGTVKIDPTGNTVQLGGTATVNTQAADNPAFQPARGDVVLTMVDGQQDAGDVAYTVPAGKELVIQSASFVADVHQGEHILNVSLNTGAGAFDVAPLSDEPAGPDDVIVGGGATTLYADPGEQVQVTMTRFPTDANAAADVHVTGYLVNLPS